ncbi:MAG TPA: 30S ribosomal protein S1 [Spirochaetes bacterium]|nr:30S ribosomal protein S1 [Spirochaetota bacterium]
MDRESENPKIPNLNEEDLDKSKNDAEEAFKEEFIKDLSSFVEGELIEGTVVAVTMDSVFIDIGYKSEGEISISEFDGKPEINDKLNVMLMRKENRDGRLVLSKQKADEIKTWDNIRDSFKEEKPVDGKITEVIKGGFSVDIEGLKAFLPISQLSNRRVEDAQCYIGTELLFKIDKINGKNNIVLSHKKYLDELNARKTEEYFKTKKEGDVVEGVIKDIVNYGAFVNLGSIDGLLHVNDMSWGKVSNPNKYVAKDEKLRLKILSMNKENKKISLGLKQLSPDPWESFEDKYAKGMKSKGTVTKLTNFGAFIELEDGIEGLLHISELSWTKRINHPKELLKVGDIVEVMLLDFDKNKRTISLGLKQVFPNPWDDIDVRYPVGSKTRATVSKVTKYGAFVEMEEGIDGFIHVSDISWTKQVKTASDIFKKDKVLVVVILSIDKEARKIQIGLKQLTENPWENLFLKYPKGSVVSGIITSVTDFGVFVKVEKEIEGLIHISKLSNEKIEDPKDHFKVGNKVKATVLNIDKEKQKITLSIKDFINRLEEKEMQKYLEDDTAKTGSITLGDIIDLSKIGK